MEWGKMCNILSSNKNLKENKMKGQLPISKMHKTKHVEFTKKHVVLGENW